jgi:uncharacterized protein
MEKYLHAHSPYRIFAFSAVATIAALIGAFVGFGASALFVAVILIVVEITFSFENAIINAKILTGLSRFWQNIFLTVGIVIAIFGMRVVFPIVIVMLTAHLGAKEVIDLALNHPEEYSKELTEAHPQIAAFGGAFLLMLALHFFLDDNRKTLWLTRIERPLQKYATFWMPAVIAIIVMVGLSLLPFNHHPKETIVAGLIGVATYSLMHTIIRIFENIKEKKDKASGVKKVAAQTGLAAFTSFLYLEILDASFSFDSVIGAFAVTNEVILIALGLGVGAIWVRSLTVFMVRRGTLQAYKYLEHGAHYTVFVLAAVLLLGIFWHVPEVIAGIIGIGLIGSAILSSRKANEVK